MSTTISASNTHDLWVEARQFSITIARPSPTTISLTVTYPSTLTISDGCVVLLSSSPIAVPNYPVDGTLYNASTDWNAPADLLVPPDGAHVVGMYSALQGNPMPAQIIDTVNLVTSFTITITNTVANQLYYGSVHPCSNVLQYYPIGVQSYPLDNPQIEPYGTPYTGNIPSLPAAPVSPSVGTVYFDQQLNSVQYWTGTQWISTRADTIVTGDVNPGVLGQVYLLGGGTLQVFNGTTWVPGSAANIQFRSGATWVPLGQVQSLVKLPTVGGLGDFVWNYTTLRPQYWDGTQWVAPNATNSLFNTGSGLVPAFVVPVTSEWDQIPSPFIGQLFYNTRVKSLNAWNGTTWTKVNTDQTGKPSSDKIAIGTDGSYEARQELINTVKYQLGYPQLCVELQEEQFNIAIQNALDKFRQWCDGAYRLRYVMFQLIANQQTYYLNSPQDGTDKVVGVSKVHRLNVLGIETANGNDAIWSSGILTSYYSAATVDILSLHMLSALSEEFQRLFAADLTFLWDEASRELFITRKVYRNEKVILEATMEKTEQEIIQDRWSKQFIQKWAMAECKYMLGMIRSRYTSGTPGATGNITQNGELLMSEARQDMIELKQSALDYEWGGHTGQANVSFLIG